MLKRKAAIQGILCAVWLILNWFRPGLLSAGVLCAVLTAQIVMQDFIQERRSLSLKKGWRAGAGFCRGCDPDNNHDTAPQQNRSGAGAALCWERIGLRIGWNTLHRSFVSGRYFKKTESSGVCDFCCDAGTLYSADANKSGKECTFPRIYAKEYRFCTAHEHALRPGRAALFTGCSSPNLQELRSRRNRRANRHAAGLAAALWLGLTLPLVVSCFSQKTGIMPAGSPIWIWSRLPALPLELLFAAVWLARGGKKEKSA